jgi:tetratricopeptide (TPR) repeat protein
MERARRGDVDEAVAGLEVTRGFYLSTQDPGSTTNEEIIEHATAFEARIDDASPHRRLRGWARLAGAVAHNWLGQMTESARWCERAISDGEAVGDNLLVRGATSRSVLVQLLGATPVGEIAEPRGGWGEHLLVYAPVVGLSGRTEEARAVATDAIAGWVELMAARPDLAEPLLRQAIERASPGFAHSICGFLARTLHELGHDDEALELLAEHADTAPDDYEAIGLQRAAHATILAGRGEVAEAERLAREGVAALEHTEDLMRHGETRLGLAFALRAAGRDDEADAEARTALDLFERKGDIPDADRVRAFIAR